MSCALDGLWLCIACAVFEHFLCPLMKTQLQIRLQLHGIKKIYDTYQS